MQVCPASSALKRLKGFGWNNVGPASQTVGQHYINKVGLCIQNVGLLLGHRQTRWINIEPTLGNRPVVAVVLYPGVEA